MTTCLEYKNWTYGKNYEWVGTILWSLLDLLKYCYNLPFFCYNYLLFRFLLLLNILGELSSFFNFLSLHIFPDSAFYYCLEKSYGSLSSLILSFTYLSILLSFSFLKSESHLPENCSIHLNKSLLKMMKNGFYFTLKIFKFLPWLFGPIKKRLG